jgi:hypothetical protein
VHAVVRVLLEEAYEVRNGKLVAGEQSVGLQLFSQVNIIAIKRVQDRLHLNLCVVLGCTLRESTENTFNLAERNVLRLGEVHILEELCWVKNVNIEHLNGFLELRLSNAALTARLSFEPLVHTRVSLL